MRTRDVIGLTTIAALVITPAIVSLTAYYVTRNPSLRPLAITLEKLIAAGQIKDRNLIIAEITFGTEAQTNMSLADHEAALAKAFDTFQTKVQVRFRSRPRSNQITIVYKVGNSIIGPYPITRAAEGIRAAVEAERMITRQRAILERQKEESLEDASFWERIFAE
ncbi:hypothetical protein [Celeribacter sp.]|uniref:hypothetical protein n=1 Tax=Celeribacter sp. TaxID=1890673 RepID=UPI003A91B08D